MAPVKQFLNVLLGVVIFGSTFAALSANVSDMDQLDEDDRQEFNAGIARATTCTKARDFECAAKQLNQAKKFVNGSRDRTILQKAAESLELERQFAIRDDAKRKYSGERLAVETNADNAEKRLAENRKANLEERRRANVARERQREAETAAARRQANTELAAYIQNLPGRMQGEMDEANARARGSSVAEDRAKARRQAEFDARIRDMEADPNSDLNRDKRARERERAEARHAESERAAKREASKNAALANDARRTADMRQQDETDANARKKREADELKSRQEQEAKRRDEERRNQELRDSIERKRVAEAEAARKQAAAAAAKLAEQQAKAQYLRSVASGTRLVATKCPDGAGKFYATGTRPNIKPEVVACVDVHYRAYCPGSRQHSNGVARNFIGMSGCFGDTYDINPKPDCNVDQVRIDIVEARVCGG